VGRDTAGDCVGRGAPEVKDIVGHEAKLRRPKVEKGATAAPFF
jgi:hypothetical protein